MIKLMNSTVLLFAFVKIGMAQEPTFDWVTNSGAANIEYAYGVTTDAAGNVYSIGVFSGTMDFDPGPGTLNLTSVGMYDMYVQKQDSDGNLIWAKSFGSTDVDFIKGITVSSTGEIYLCGNFFLTCDFDPGPGVANKTSGGSTDPFILKLDNNGNFLWVKTFSSVSQGSAEELITDLSGNVYVAGSFNGTTDFDPDFGTFNLTSAGFSDIFICKLGSDGSLIWAKKVGGTDSDLARDINLDASGNVFICGGFESASVDFDPGAGTFSLIQAGLGDAYLLKLNSGGNFVNAVKVGSTGYDVATGLDLDASGNCYLAGEYNGTVDFDPSGSTNNLVSGGFSDGFIWSTSNDLNYNWAKSFGGTWSDQLRDLELNSTGEIFAVGKFTGTADLDPGISSYNVTSNGGEDIFFVHVNSSGNFVWARSIGSGSNESVEAMTIDLNDALLVNGDFSGNMDFDPDAGVSSLTPNSSDNFVLRLNICSPTGSSESIAACDFYTWPVTGLTYSTSGSYNHMVSSLNGCDSLLTLNLTVNSSYSSSENVTACDSYLWPVTGLTYLSSTTESVTFTSIFGCDSTLNLQLTIISSSSSTDIISACDAVTWIDGNTYTASTNSPTHIIPNSAGCDSIITLNLTITNSPIANASLTGFILTSISTASTYQWIDCDNGNAIIAGETAQIFSPNTDGNYAVILSNGSCSDTSSCVTVSGLGFNEENIFNALIYPNPTSGKLMIVFPNEIDNVQVNIIDGIGQIISSEKNFSGVLYEFDLIGESGIYVVEIISDSAHLRIPVSKI